MSCPIAENILSSASRRSERFALYVHSRHVTYDELMTRAFRVGNCLSDAGLMPGDLCILLGMRSATTYTGLLGSILAGAGYVPTNPRYPAARNLTILRRAGTPFCVLDTSQIDIYAAVLDQAAPLTVIVEDAAALATLRGRWPQHRFLDCGENQDTAPQEWRQCSPEDTFYLLFTSGSTGEPKGVGVTRANAAHYFSCLDMLSPMNCEDRCLQMFDLTFDFHAHPLWRAFLHGACLYVEDEAARLMPAKFLSEHSITQWNSVPTTAAQMQRLRMLKPGAFPAIRYSMFCGEGLSAALAEAWRAAAPNSVVDNLYGPTEATIACTGYRIEGSDALERDAENGLTPIGIPFPGMRTRVVNNALDDVSSGECGELLLAGPQVAPGYWRNAQKTEERFIRHADGTVWYRTGDLVREAACGLVFLGRSDSQIKLRGFRVELSEVEGGIMAAAKVSLAVALPRVSEDGAITGLIAFIPAECPVPESEILQRCREQLPSYMVPVAVRKLAEFPRNANGKIDRRALQKTVCPQIRSTK